MTEIMKDTGISLIKNKFGQVKEYEKVAFRIKKFRDLHPDWTVRTRILERTEDCVVMVCEIIDEVGRLLATGHAEEMRRSSEINKTSALENAETSAIGRALAALGLGGTEFASAEEVVVAQEAQQDLVQLREKCMPRLEDAASINSASLKTAWEALSVEGRRACKSDLGRLKTLATNAETATDV